MSRMAVWMTVGCLVAASSMAMAQQQRKPGLWELTTTMTWQQAPFAAPPPAPRTQAVCFTQAMIEKYGAIMPSARNGCKVENVSVKPGHMTAEWVCTGNMSGKGALESSWRDAEHATGSIHYKGTVGGKPMEWTSRSTAVFKSADCGSVKPAPMPNQ